MVEFPRRFCKLIIFACAMAWPALTAMAQRPNPLPGTGVERGATQGPYWQAHLWPIRVWRKPVAQRRDSSVHGNEGRFFGRPIFGQRGAITSEPDRAVGLEWAADEVLSRSRDRDEFSIATSGKGLTGSVDAARHLGLQGRGPEDFVHWLGKGEKGHFEWVSGSTAATRSVPTVFRLMLGTQMAS